MKLPVTLLLLSMLSMASWRPAATYELKPTPSTVVWGYYSASAKPAIKVQSGDTVRLESASNRDLAVLSADPLSAQEKDIREITPLMTVGGGRIVHESGN
jgi:predicted amidohydrolase YtcJ